MEGVAEKKKRKKIGKACIPCRRAKLSCDVSRPCMRCLRRGQCEGCQDAPEKASIDCSSNGNSSTLSSSSSSVFLSVAQPPFSVFNAPEYDFFQMYQNTHSLPMDDPVNLFESFQVSASTVPTVPNCFSKFVQPSLIGANDGAEKCMNTVIDLEDLFPSNPFFNSGSVCKSRGLPGCTDCTFNVDNILPQPLPITPKIQYETQHKLKKAMPFNFHSIAHLDRVVTELGLENVTSTHIVSLVQKLLALKTQSNNDPNTLSNYRSYLLFPSSPSVILSPSGLISHCNEAFSCLTGMDMNLLVGFCFYSLIDLLGILSILDMSMQGKGVGGRCVVRQLGSTLIQNCAVSLSTVHEEGALWLILQLIP